MTKQALRISLVIPVYNEESHLADCLTSAVTQRSPFNEIIVVDNNSTDNSAAIARLFPGVKVVSAKRQGVVHARNRGFNAARGDIIARIDADTRLPVDWTERLAEIFSENEVDAVSGAISYRDIAARRLVDACDLRIRSWLARKMPQHVYLLGANMALRRSAWRDIRRELCNRAGVHEDLDVSAHLGERGYSVVFNPRLLAAVSGRRADCSTRAFAAYLVPMPRTYAVHGIREQRYMYPVIWFVFAVHLPLRILYRGYDEQHGGFSLTKLFKASASLRVNPATFVDS